MNRQQYRKYTMAQLKGLRVRTIANMRNGMMEISEGTICKIVDKRSGLSLKTDACPACGVSIFISKVAPNKVVLLDIPEARPRS